jgi:hypothetical protein
VPRRIRGRKWGAWSKWLQSAHQALLAILAAVITAIGDRLRSERRANESARDMTRGA